MSESSIWQSRDEKKMIHQNFISSKLTRKSFDFMNITSHASDKINFTQNKRVSSNFEIMLKIQDFLKNQATNIKTPN